MTPTREKIIAALTCAEWKTSREVVEETGINHIIVNSNMRVLCLDGHIAKKAHPDNPYQVVYKVSGIPAVGRIKLLDSYLRGCRV